VLREALTQRARRRVMPRKMILEDLRTASAHVRRWLAALAKPPLPRALAPGIVPLVLLPFLVPLIGVELTEPLFGDTLMFQYFGWGLRHGMRLYRDMGTADGPLITFLHAAMQVVGGSSDHGFRVVDLLLQASGGAAIGAVCAPSGSAGGGVRLARRLAWGALGATIWVAFYLTLDWGATTEREVYYALFGALGLALLYRGETFAPKHRARAIAVGAFLVTAQAFGKPTGIVYPAVGLCCLLLGEPGAPLSRAARVRSFVRGALVCVFLFVLAMLFAGSLRRYVFWCFTIPYRGNLFLFRVNWLRLLFEEWEPFRLMAVVSLVGGVAATALGLMPKRILPLSILPLVLFLGACLQGRGYRYQVMPVAMACNFLWILVLGRIWQEGDEHPWTTLRSAVAVVALMVTAAHFLDGAVTGPYKWNGDAQLLSQSPRQFAETERQVGRYLQAHTKPDDELFVYSAGENAHVVLAAAERRSASPFFHSFWLDPIGLLPQSEHQPSPDERAALEALQTTIRREACDDVRDRAPAAMAFNLLPQVFKVCPALEEMLKTRYAHATTIGAFQIYARRN
jgi:hypothetical protein